MALTAETIGVDNEFMVELAHGDDALDRYSGGDGEKVKRKCNIAADEFRSAAIKGGYLATEIDALTATTLPPRWQEIIGHIALEELSAGGIGRPDAIKEKADQARKSLSYLAGGAETIDGLTRVSAGGTAVGYRAPEERKFDRKNESQEYNSRDRKI